MRVTQLAGWAGAVVGPLGVLCWALGALSPEPTLGAAALNFERLVRGTPSQVVVVGASYANTDVDATVLARELVPGSPPALILPVAASAAPVWYAVIKERVYANGLSPEFIVLPVSISTALMTRLSPSTAAKLADQMPIPDEVVARRTFSATWFPALDRLVDSRGAVRDGFLNAFRDAPPRWLLQADTRAVEAAGTTVFGEHHETAGSRALPTVENDLDPDAALSAAQALMVSDPADSYLSDIADLAAAHDGRLVVVLPPTLSPRALGQSVDPEVEARVYAWAKSRGVVLLDYRGLVWDASRFKDGRHMRPLGARILSELIAEDVLRLGSGGGVVTANNTAPATVTRTGSTPALPELRWIAGDEPCSGTIPLPEYAFLGRKAMAELFPRLVSPIRVWEGDTLLSPNPKRGSCTGAAVHRTAVVVSRLAADGPPLRLAWAEIIPEETPADRIYWVYPGTALTWSFSSPLRSSPTSVELTASVLGAGAGTPELRVGDVHVPLVVAGSTATATALPPEATGWTIGVHSPADGPFLVVRTLGLREGETSTAVVALPPPRNLDVVHEDGWTVTGTPAPAPAFPLQSRGAAAWFVIPWKPAADCSPLRVEHAGALLDEMPPGRRRDGTGTRHTGTRLGFDPLPGTEATGDYAVVYDPERLCPKTCRNCQQDLWLYPGDSFQAEIPEGKRLGFGAPLVRLRLSATLEHTPDAADAPLRVEVTLGDEVLLKRSLLPAEFGLGLDLPLSRPVAPTDEGALRVTWVPDPRLPPVLLAGSFQDQ